MKSTLTTLERPASANTDQPILDVLIVDDDPELRRALEVGLGHLGNLCVSAASIRDAVSLLESIEVDAVICDYHLPDGTAIAFLSRLVETRPGLPAILITADPRPHVRIQAESAGFGVCLLKPLNVEELGRVLRQLCSEIHPG
jgi:CheY-like chemotaxis protein